MTITIDGGAGITFPDTVQQTNATTNTGGTPRYYAARAWVTFDSGAPPTILSSVNVASITRNGTGDYTITFTSAMPNANYAVAGMGQGTSTLVPLVFIDPATTPTTSAVRIQVVSVSFPSSGANTAVYDASRISIVVFA